MDGFTAAKTQDVEKMTKPQLAAIGKAAVAKDYFSKAEIKDLKVKNWPWKTFSLNLLVTLFAGFSHGTVSCIVHER